MRSAKKWGGAIGGKAIGYMKLLALTAAKTTYEESGRKLPERISRLPAIYDHTLLIFYTYCFSRKRIKKVHQFALVKCLLSSSLNKLYSLSYLQDY